MISAPPPSSSHPASFPPSPWTPLTAQTMRDEVVRLREENTRLIREVERLRAEALTDALTGLPNRRCLDERLEAEMSRARRYGEALSVLSIDVDNFKRVNDTWGHAKGDEVLVWVARFLQSQLRMHDIAGRLGGDEFVVILPATDKRSAELVADRLRKTLAALRGRVDHPVSLSIGVASLDPRDPDARPEALLGGADHAMYRQKGRTRKLPRAR